MEESADRSNFGTNNPVGDLKARMQLVVALRTGPRKQWHLNVDPPFKQLTQPILSLELDIACYILASQLCIFLPGVESGQGNTTHCDVNVTEGASVSTAAIYLSLRLVWPCDTFKTER